MRRTKGRLARDTEGAVAPTIALALFALIGAGGIAFDYARLATLDSELQNAADQAALAAASQLDGQTGATTRAIAAAQTLLTNKTLLGNDGGGVTIATGTNDTGKDANGADVTTRVRVNFYETRANAEADTNSFVSSATNADTRAKFVKVEVAGREAIYALTPIVGAFRSGLIEAAATAGLGSAICKVPPVMMCNPQETGTNKEFDVGSYKGVGIRLVEGGNGASWAPGNFGYLQTNMGPGASVLEYALGANSPPGQCLPVGGVTTKPGENTSVTDAINTRFDIYENGLTNDCTTSSCSPSPNVRKDVVRPDASTNFGFKTGNDPWDLPSVQYLPSSSTSPQTAPIPTSMGHPRDMCHAVSADGNCTNGRIGNGTWDRNLYFFVNHKALAAPADSATPDSNWQNIVSLRTYALANGYTAATIPNITRYDVYKWEIAADQLNSYSYDVVGKNKTTTFFNHARPQSSTGLAAGPNQMDRRMSSVAVVNCIEQSVQGQAKNVTVKKWIDIFFVEPSLARDRTVAGDIYVEVVRETNAGGIAPTNPQVVRRDVPYLIR